MYIYEHFHDQSLGRGKQKKKKKKIELTMKIKNDNGAKSNGDYWLYWNCCVNIFCAQIIYYIYIAWYDV